MSFPRYPKYKASGVDWLGDVPEHWTRFRLQFLLKDGKDGIRIGPFGSSVKLEDMVPDGFKVYGQENVIYRDFGLGERFLSHSKFLELADYEISSGDVLVTMAGTAGRCQVVPQGINRGIMDSHLVRMRFQAIHAWPPLIPYLIEETKYVIDQLVVAGRGSTMHGLNSTIIRKLEVCLPPVDEQRRITSFIDRETAKIDGLVREQRRLIELLKEKRQAVISHTVTKGLNPHAPLKPSGIEWLGDVPEHWQVKRLKHVAPAVTVGIVVNPSTFACDEGLPFIHGGDIREGIINWSDARKISRKDSEQNCKTMLECGDVITVRVGAGRGTTAVVPPACAGGNCASVMLIRRGSYDSSWLCYAMNDRLVQFQIEVVEYGAAQPQFNISHAIEFWLPVPPPDEQTEIAERLDAETAKLDALTAEADRAIELLQERRTALISAAVTGKIDVRGLAATEAA